MLSVHRFSYRLMASLMAITCTTIAAAVPAASAQVATTTISLSATDDVGTIESQPAFSAPNSYLVLNQRGNGDFDYNFIQFDLSAIPAGATVNSAALHLNIFAAGGSLDVEAGRAEGAWDESTINWSNQPAVTFGGPVETISAVGDASWSATALVQEWHAGSRPNHGFVLRGINGNGAGVRADSKEWGIAPKLVVTYSDVPGDGSHDLGDAPDSSNHPNIAMAAYVSTPANYPTVFDPATGQPQGPLHLDPRPFHLGQQVSREIEADGGPDEDPANNIEPAANQPNLDAFDDGVNPNAWNLVHCARANLPVRVFISPQAVNWFQQHNQPGYLNVWLDSNRDGDWADGFVCQDSQGQNHGSVEHIVIDAPINVVGLGAGLHIGQPLTGYITLPAAFAQYPSWIRVTLSEQPSNKTLQFGNIKYGDGRGFATPFNTGETEDYRAFPGLGGPGDR